VCVRVYVRVYVRVCACVAGYAGETRPLPRNPKDSSQTLPPSIHRIEGLFPDLAHARVEC